MATETRKYDSPVREQAKAETRARILEAVVRVVLDDGIHAFTVQNVAKKAGVSHRTVYRHFETREDLLDGLAAWLDETSAHSGVPSVPASVEDVLDSIEPSFRAFSVVAEGMQAYVMTSIALRWQVPGRRSRSLAFEKITRAAFPNLPKQQAREAAAVIRTLASSRSWYLLSVEAGLGTDSACRSATWAVRTLFKDLRARDRAAAKQPRRS